MRLVRRWRHAPVAADLGPGFWVTEAPALQAAIRSALRGTPAGDGPVRVGVELSPGGEGRVVVTANNLIVGFAPAERSADLLRQILAAGPAALVGEGRAHRVGDEWRIWAGPPWPEHEPAPEYPAPRIEPEAAHIFGVQLRTPPRS